MKINKEFVKKHILVLYFCATWLIGMGIMISLMGIDTPIFWMGFFATILSASGMSVCPTWKEFLKEVTAMIV